MNQAVTVQGSIQADGSLKLSAAVPLPPGPVEVVVRPLPRPASRETGSELLKRFRAEEEASGYVPRSAEEVHAQLQQMTRYAIGRL